MSSLSERGRSLLGRRVLGDGLRALADGVLGQLSGQQQTDGRLDLATGDRRTTVVVRETGRLGGDALEDVVDEAVHDRHRLAADARVGVDLLEHLVDVDGVRLSSSALALLVAGPHGLRLAGGLLRSLARWFRWHSLAYDVFNELIKRIRFRLVFIAARASGWTT